MYPTIPASPDSAAPYWTRTEWARIELVPSRRAAILAFAWLAALCGMSLFGVALPLPVRITLGLLILGTGVPGIRRYFLLSAQDSIRAISWQEGGRWSVQAGSGGREQAVTLGAGSFRLGCAVFVLRFDSADRILSAVIDVQRQDPVAIRGLARRLEWLPEVSADKGRTPS